MALDVVLNFLKSSTLFTEVSRRCSRKRERSAGCSIVNSKRSVLDSLVAFSPSFDLSVAEARRWGIASPPSWEVL